MQRAECEAIRNLIGALCLVPFDMSSFKGDGVIVHTNSEFADGTAVSVCVKHLWGERWVSRPAAEPYKSRFDADRLQDFVMKGARKMGFDKHACEPLRKPPVVLQQCMNSTGESAVGVEA